jgi:vanillate O-demethylase monooxygenase subunit
MENRNMQGTRVAFLRNAWYAAALSTELRKDAFLARTLLETPVVMYRKQDGTPVALHDRCPHRFAPLHLGRRIGDEISCVYHALRFDCNGQCTYNPHGAGHIPKAARVRAFPLLERNGFVWIWMGDEAVDPGRLPDFSGLDGEPATALAFTYMHMKANYELIVDNVMDLSHIDHVHSEIITTRGQLSPLVPDVRETNDAISARWEWKQTPAMLIFADFLPNPKAEARMYFNITWTPPASIQLSVGATQDEGALDLTNCVGQYDLHTTTPESALTSHYWFATRRNHLENDGDFNAKKIAAMHAAFQNEDGPVIEAVQRSMGDGEFFDLNPVLMSNDIAPVRVRKLLKRLISEECIKKAA